MLWGKPKDIIRVYESEYLEETFEGEDFRVVMPLDSIPFKEVRSLEELPQWIQERIAVLHLLDAAAESPLGGWGKAKQLFVRGDHRWVTHYYIVPQPGDPEWEK